MGIALCQIKGGTRSFLPLNDGQVRQGLELRYSEHESNPEKAEIARLLRRFAPRKDETLFLISKRRL